MNLDQKNLSFGGLSENSFGEFAPGPGLVAVVISVHHGARELFVAGKEIAEPAIEAPVIPERLVPAS